MAHRRAGRSVSPKRKQAESPDLNALAHEQGLLLSLLWRGMMALLLQEEPRAYRRLWAALERHGLAGPIMYFRSDRQSGEILPYSEDTGLATGVGDDFRGASRSIRDAVLDCARAFAADPYVGRLQGKKRIRRVSPRELLLAYQAARWKVESDAKARGTRRRGESLTGLAHVLVGERYNLTPETVRSFLQDARRSVPPETRKVLALLGNGAEMRKALGLLGNAAWELTLGAKPGGPKK